MKKILAFVSMALLLSACYSELKDRVDDLEERVDRLEGRVDTLNQELSVLQQLIDGKKFISDIKDNEDGTHVITFVTPDGSMSTMTLTDGATPQISVKQSADGKYWWALDGEFILDANGDKIPVTGERGVTPSLKIENGKWYVSYDYGITYQECGQATGEDGDAFFKDAKLSEDGKLAYLTLVDGTVLTFEVYKEFGIAVEVTSQLIYSGQTKKYAYVITGGDRNTQLEAIAKGKWEAEVEKTDESTGFIVVTAAADEATVGKVILLLSDGADKTLMRTLTFAGGNLSVSTSSVEVPAAGGTASVEVTTNLEFTASIEADQDWVRLVETKAYEIYTKAVQVTVDENPLPYARTAKMTLFNEDKVLETVVIYQNPKTFPEEAMVLVVSPTATAKDTSVILQFTQPDKTSELYIDWGDGSKVDTIVNKNNAQHYYDTPGKLYSVTLTGTLNSFSSAKSNYSHKKDLREIVQWGKMNLKSLCLENHEALEKIPEANNGEMSGITSALRMFYNCKSLKTVPASIIQGLSPNTTNFNYVFYGCESLEYLDPDLFKNATKGSTAWQMFYNCKKLKAVPTLKYFSFGKNENNPVGSLFYGCESLEYIPENMLNSTLAENIKCTQINVMFSGCKSLKSIPDSYWDYFNWEKIVQFQGLFKDCESLTSESIGVITRAIKVYNWANVFNGCKSLTTLPETTVTIDGEEVSVPVYKRSDAEYKAYFANRNYSTGNCFTGCTNLEGYYTKIPTAWGGGWDGSLAAPTVAVTASLPTNKGYYAIDYNIKGTDVVSAYYLLTAKVTADDYLAQYNNSYTEMVEKEGTQISSSYIKAINTETGLTLNFTSGVPNVEYILIVAAKNSLGEMYAYKVQSTTSIPKGSDAYESYLGEWTVTSTSSVSDSAGYVSKPLTFDVTIEPYRVDSIYTVYGWGVTKFSDEYPCAMFFENNRLCVYTGADRGSVIYSGYTYDDQGSHNSNWNVALQGFMHYDDDSYSVVMTGGEKIFESDSCVNNTFSFAGIKSAYLAESDIDIAYSSFDFFLVMGGMGWSKIFIPSAVVKEKYLTYGDKGNAYVPYSVGPFTFTRKSSATTASVSASWVRENRKLIDGGKNLPVALMK